jgi:pre-rRNA-processing protein TSR3
MVEFFFSIYFRGFLFPPTIVIRHRKENLKKCSLAGLEKRDDFLFFTYPLKEEPPCAGYILLSIDAEEDLSLSDASHGLLVLDATWRLANHMKKNIQLISRLIPRRLPKGLKTAYPRRQQDCPSPEQGLASIEALAAAYALLGRDPYDLLSHYFWKKDFLLMNQDLCFSKKCSKVE